jgi:rRNA-processing protein FCF1
MLEDVPITALSIDANILIDYLETDGEIISLFSRNFAPIFVADIVATEINRFREIHPSTLGITVIETPYTVLLESSDRPASLSIQDFACMRLAQQRELVCATNDKALRRECQNRNIPVIRGLTLMRQLTGEGLLDIKRAVECAWAIHHCNKTITEDIIHCFIKELRSK